jgi:predicted nuclease of predicted toxin-antitoxin system
VKLWIDECLSPALVGQAHDRGYEATCTRDRGQLGLPDDDLIVLAVDGGFAFVTNNHADFRGLLLPPSCTPGSSSCRRVAATISGGGWT